LARSFVRMKAEKDKSLPQSFTQTYQSPHRRAEMSSVDTLSPISTILYF
jgi:hypothetical protein